MPRMHASIEEEESGNKKNNEQAGRADKDRYKRAPSPVVSLPLAATLRR